jgi:hypothetical protein
VLTLCPLRFDECRPRVARSSGRIGHAAQERGEIASRGGERSGREHSPLAQQKAALRALVTEAAIRGLRGGSSISNKNPIYAPPSIGPVLK